MAGALIMVVPAPAQQRGQPPRVSLGILVNEAPAHGAAPGVIVRSVSPKGPAGKAGIAANDVITKIGNQSVSNYEQLEHVLSQHKPGDKIAVTIQHNGKPTTVTVTLGERGAAQQSTDEGGADQGFGQSPRGGNARPSAYIGIEAEPLTPEIAQDMGIKTTHGAVIRNIVPNSPAAEAKLQSGDVITRINGKDITDINELREAVEQAGVGKTMELSVLRDGKTQHVKVKLQRSPGNFQGTPFGQFGAPFGGQGGFGNFGPGGFGNMGPGFGNVPFGGADRQQQRIQQLERRVRDLERRLQQLEQQHDRTPNK
jgi:S1-C subfamily serine protease